MGVDVQMFVAQKALIEKNEEVLVLVDPVEGLDFPGGKVQEDEDVITSLQREVREEVGWEIVVGKPFCAKIDVFPKEHEFVGKQVYVVAFACAYAGGEIALSSEHSSYKWVNKETYMNVNDGSWFFSILESYFEG
jgi:8-oxo-dGTP diphosphatase